MNVMDMIRMGKNAGNGAGGAGNGFQSRFGGDGDEMDGGSSMGAEPEAEGPEEADGTAALEALGSDPDFMGKLQGLIDALKKQSAGSPAADMGMMSGRKLPSLPPAGGAY